MSKRGFSLGHIHLDRNRVQPVRGVFQAFLAKILAKDARKALVFGASDGELRMRRSQTSRLARLHFDKSDLAGTLFEGDNVQLPDSVAQLVFKIHIQDPIAVLFQVIGGDNFAKFSNFFVLLTIHCFQYSRISRQKNRLSKADLHSPVLYKLVNPAGSTPKL